MEEESAICAASFSQHKPIAVFATSVLSTQSTRHCKCSNEASTRQTHSLRGSMVSACVFVGGVLAVGGVAVAVGVVGCVGVVVAVLVVVVVVVVVVVGVVGAVVWLVCR